MYKPRFLFKKNKEDGKLQMTPMIDVVFLLLVFFMCATKFKVPDYRLDYHFPRDRGQNAVEAPRIDDVPELRITLKPLDAPEGQARASIRIGRDTWVQPSELGIAVKANYQALSNASNAAGKKIPVVIDGDGEVDFEYVMLAFDACLAAEITEIRFETPHP